MLKQRALIGLGTFLSLLLLTHPAHATVFSKTLTWDAGETELVAAGNWDGTGTSIEYVVDDETSPGFWHYKYTLTVHTDQAAGISHLNIETSEDFTEDKLENSTWDGETEIGLLQSNPGSPMPEAMNGIKFDELPGGDTFVVEFDSLRLPIWGDFFAKGGASSVVYNAGFGSPDSDPDPIDPFLNPPANVSDHILVPDTSELPEPASMAILALGGVFVLVRRRRK
jgi:hypothetical protein